ncbi:hypothetical protein JCM17478_06530 [Thermopirellula anaerolimosa]
MVHDPERYNRGSLSAAPIHQNKSRDELPGRRGLFWIGVGSLLREASRSDAGTLAELAASGHKSQCRAFYHRAGRAASRRRSDTRDATAAKIRATDCRSVGTRAGAGLRIEA